MIIIELYVIDIYRSIYIYKDLGDSFIFTQNMNSHKFVKIIYLSRSIKSDSVLRG